MPDASPVKWHLAHTTWFFETFILARYEQHFAPFHPAFRVLFNSYYNGVGERHPRPQRGLLTRPTMRDVLAYRANVDARMARLLAGCAAPQFAQLLMLGLQHEQQHQELILTDVKHLLSCSPLFPAYRDDLPGGAAPAATLDFTAFEGGLAAWSRMANTWPSSTRAATTIPRCGCPKAGTGLVPMPSPIRCTGNATLTAHGANSPCTACSGSMRRSRPPTCRCTRPMPAPASWARACPRKLNGKSPRAAT